MRLLLTLPLLALLACSSSEIPEEKVSAPQTENKDRVYACTLLARVAGAASDFRDLGVSQEDFYQRLTLNSKPSPVLEQAFKEIIREVYTLGLSREETKKYVFDICVAGAASEVL